MSEDLLAAVERGEIDLHELDDHTDAETATEIRRAAIEAATDADLETVGETAIPAADAEPNIENMIGAAQVPMGVAGPVPIDGEYVDRSVRVPLATTEGALVASINRGMAAIREADGAIARIVDSGITRAPVFTVADVSEAQQVADWVAANADRVGAAAAETDPHLDFVDLEPYVVGDSVFVRIRYDTGDAMGMNMATIGSRSAAELIESETPADLVAMSGNLCSDKKPAAINSVEGRGYTVAADVELDAEVVADRFGTTPAAIAEVNTRKNLVGSAKAGALGFNAHAANVIGAAFLALGQDEAQVVEGSNTITTVEERDGSLYVSVTLASLEVGTVGGGTGLPTQREALSVMDLAGGGDPPGTNGAALAEIIATATLAGELSLLGALAGRHLTSAHEEHGR
ncbi:hydroxymethylglutaryl-CoA reductase [Halococcoides cellulosivorans]|uniref:hydroxymethylglutaryl-CoA reductase (NADPH) n=1 Tax=Halococcoides cellulosivorans TaxID=1679096 RepID=A0A2R4X0J4_9EURY|nr:hydroxymethylglutaryl-CoA reductase [Halococcoides cellulosivorans]AWB27281.1 3-hydroxy-3-methylglutaryl-CoA reductase [Halococcoides cellulosivorans]